LEHVELDAVYIFGDNRGGVEMAVAAAAKKLPFMLEKPLASTYAGAARIYGAASNAGVQMMVNWPIAWWPAVQEALRLIATGMIGAVYQVNYRAAHAGPRELGCSPFFSEWLYDPERNGAGALMDYCCYGCALTCLLLGLPSQVTAVAARLRKPDLPADDNAVLIMQHPGAISTSTASWTQSGHMTSYEPMIYGSSGTLVVRGDGQQLFLANEAHPDGIALEVPPPAYHNATAFFLDHLRNGTPIGGLCSGEVGLMAQQTLEAGILAATEGRAVSLPLPVSRLAGSH
jgi:predicted dehydrogenase